jgi:outer membrane protein OmpU
MKKVLLTTTALVMTAGVAAADISMTGTGGVAAASTSGANAQLYTGVDLNFNFSATADNGLTVSTSIDTGAGETIDYNDDFAVDTQAAAADADLVTMTMGYAGYTIVAAQGDVDDLYDDAQHHDASIAGNVGGIDLAVTLDIQDNEGSYSLGYTAGDLTATLTGSTDKGTTGADDHSGSKIALSYAMGDLSLNASTNDNGDEASTHTAGFSYAMDAITLSYTLENAKDAGWKNYDASVSYSAGALTASIAQDEAGVSEVVGTVDLGGGTTLFASSKSTKGTNNFQTVGLSFTF